ncbi:hypothetical protein PUMCH_002069 [Australozyma saopauloensis]|uniref:Coatomer subunit epsilon n=1 Tax=Australozyma saopauloensis TaxID=291208 RepID=A0AAX4H8H4_9ASCO|nr:hypothetical protein PUMCH_002069 [[Candida] saopauloensis]
MNDINDSGELFTIRNQFYTGQHQKVTAYNLDQFSAEAQPKVMEFQIRSHVALSEDASQLIDEGRSLFADQGDHFDLLQAWNDLNAFGTEDSTYFDAIEEAEFETQACLTALYFIRVHKGYEQAIEVLSKYINSVYINVHELEPYLLLVQLNLINGKYAEANRVFQKFHELPYSARDDIVYHVTESWIMAIKGGFDNVNNSSCFYDEIMANDFEEDAQGKYHILSVLFALTVQLKRFPEAQDFLEQIDALNFKGDVSGDLLANKITFEYLTKGGENVLPLLKQLAQLNPEHELLADYKEKNEKFDAIVEKYQPAL